MVVIAVVVVALALMVVIAVVVVALALVVVVVAVLVMALILVAVVVVIIVVVAGRKLDDIDMIAHPKDGGSAGFHGFKGVQETLLQTQTVGHHQGRLLHPGPVGHRRLIPVGVDPGPHDRLHFG